MRRYVPQAPNVQTQHYMHPSPKPNALSCLLKSLLSTRHLNPIELTLLSTCALCNLHVTLTLILLYGTLKLTGIILRACELV